MVGYIRYIFKKITVRKLIFISIIGILIIYMRSKQKHNENELLKDLKALVLKFHRIISESEFKVYSQQKEDGVFDILIKMFDLDSNKYFVEIGTQSGVECNTR